jgi:ribosomal protein S18 acetylase RimI-like enzyme
VALFAEYDPEGKRGAEPPGLATREGRESDVDALAALRVERGDATAEQAASTFRRILFAAEQGTSYLRVAEVDRAVIAYGAVDWLRLGTIPEGWYLGGVIVTPAMRRRGIGDRLTRERLAWIGGRASRAWYFVNARNRASIDLHDRLGFREEARGIAVPGLTFTGGVGLLFSVGVGAGTPFDTLRA